PCPRIPSELRSSPTRRSADLEIIDDCNLYGGTYNLFVHTLPRFGITVKIVDGTDPEAFREAITDKTKAIFGETITNPSLYVFDIDRKSISLNSSHDSSTYAVF